MRPQADTPPQDLALASLAGAQYGVVDRHQLLALGLDGSAIKRRVRAGRLHILHRGVYAVGHTVLDANGRWLAAVLACGPGAVLSHASAAALWDLRSRARSSTESPSPRRPTPWRTWPRPSRRERSRRPSSRPRSCASSTSEPSRRWPQRPRGAPAPLDFSSSCVVEVDGFRYHGSRAAFERDRARDVKLTTAGWRVVRFTDRQVRRAERFVGERLELLLA